MNKIIESQRAYFKTGETIPYKFRLNALKRLKEAIINNQAKLEEALYKDLNKTSTEAYMTEIGLVLSDLNYQIKHLKKHMKAKRCHTPLANFKGTSFITPYPYGNTLIISPWNYPVLLTFEPLAGAIAAGNTCVIKPSEYSPYTSQVILDIISSTFDSKYLAVILGDGKIANDLINQKWDYIFFTGGTTIGKIVYEAASKNLTPVTLELGGKSPCIIDSKAKIDLAAKRIVFGKFVNCGQTCVAPDYILVDEAIKDSFISSLKKWIDTLYGDAINNKDYGKIINEKHFNRLTSYLDGEDIIYGGKSNKETLKIEPTLINIKSFDTPVMSNEIFGPLLPIYSYKTLDEALNIIAKYKKPLASYLFTNDKKVEQKVLNSVQFGGGCINDTIMHLATNSLGFGGVGNSGIGQYHGKLSFDTFSHNRSVVRKANWIDLWIRYTPYTNFKTKLIKIFLK